MKKKRTASPTQHKVMRGSMYGTMRSRNGRGRRNPSRQVTRTGWNAPIRTKPSKYAPEFAYEVRMWHEPNFALPDEALPHQDLIDQLRVSSDCRIVGLHPHQGRSPRRRMVSIRLLLRREQDLMQVRLLTDDRVFRVYRLIAREGSVHAAASSA